MKPTFTDFMNKVILLKSDVTKYMINKKYSNDEIRYTLKTIDIISNMAEKLTYVELVNTYNLLFEKYDTLKFWRLCDSIGVNRNLLDTFNAMAIIDTVIGKNK